ncbi:MAG: hypothetical protein IJL79_01020 [Candidatus Methanomethylophilaceae archaeon]|nr:hypothetical protein [Candidatus Methanomethylophilaceae archaeon]
MRSSDEHLEEALAEYNDKVNSLELDGRPEELLEALVNRSTILMLMGSYVSSMTDLEDAMELMEEMNQDGIIPNLGTYVKVYENHGHMCCEDDPEMMLDDYLRIIPKLIALNAATRHYDRKSLVNMCLECSKELIDSDFSENSLPFLEKGLIFLGPSNDDWILNRRAEMYSLMGEAHHDMGVYDDALSEFTRSIDIASELYLSNRIDDDMLVSFVYSFVLKGDIEDRNGNREESIDDYESAADILDQLENEGRTFDKDLLLDMHRTLSRLLMEAGNIERAETHLVKAMKMEVPNVDIAIKKIGAEKKD